VLGFGLEYDVFRDSGIHGDLFEDVVEGSPALLMFMDLHTAVATPRALELAGVTGPMNFSENAEIVCREGAPTGELREWAAVATVERAMPQPTDAERYALHSAALLEHAAAGLTGGHAMDGTLATLDLLRELEANGDLVQRFVVPFTIVPESQPDDWEALLPHRCRRPSLAGRRREVLHRRRDRRGNRLAVRARRGGRGDAAVLARSGALSPRSRDVRARRLPVRDARHGGPRRPGSAGRLPGCWRGAVTRPAPHRAHRDPAAPRPAALRSRGRRRLDAGAAHALVRARPLRQLVAAPRPGALGAGTRLSGPLTARVRGRRRARLRLAGRALRSPARPLGGTASPPAGTARPEPVHDQAVDALTALAGYTTAAAATVGEDARLGRIRPRYTADLTVFADDPVECDPDELPELPVVLTVVDGEVVHRAD
jgi:Amidohydrolase family